MGNRKDFRAPNAVMDRGNTTAPPAEAKTEHKREEGGGMLVGNGTHSTMAVLIVANVVVINCCCGRRRKIESIVRLAASFFQDLRKTIYSFTHLSSAAPYLG